MTKTITAAAALSLTAMIVAAAAQAQTDPKLMTCAQLMASQDAEMAAFKKQLAEQSAYYEDLNDFVADDAMIGRVVGICAGNPEMMAAEAMRQARG
jgi:hypothetical protein